MQKHPPLSENNLTRILECWLPLAQDLNEYYEWGYDISKLEALIVAAWPALAVVPTPLAARAVLWHCGRQAQASDKPPCQEDLSG